LLAADFDGNGRPDLLVFRSGEMQVVSAGHGRTLVPGPITSITPKPGAPVQSATGDFDGDGNIDVAVVAPPASRYESTLALYFGDGTGAFDASRVESLPKGYFASRLEAADFDGDGKAEIAAIGWHRAPSSLVRWNGSGLDLVTSFDGAQDTFATAVGDVSGDGLPDLFLGGYLTFGGYLESYLGDRDRGLVNLGFSGDLHGGPHGLAIADFDGNGTSDVAVETFEGWTKIFLGDGRGAFHSSTTTDNPYPVARLAALALDGEPGSSSLVIERYDGAVDLWPNRCPDSDLILPALLSLSGVGGVRFESQLTLTNRGAAPLSLALTYTSALGSGSGTGSFSLPPGQKTFTSAFDFLRSAGIPIPAGADGLGTLGILVTTGSPTDVAALVRTTSQAPGAAKGGVAYAGIPFSHAVDGAAWIPWLREDSQDRSNVAAVHAGGPSDGPITLRLTIRSGDPAHPGVAVLEDVTLAPGGLHQWDRVLSLSGLHATRGSARIERVSGKARFAAYGIVNDNGTGDGSFVPAVTDQEPSVARGALVVPAIVETGRFSTELVVTNVSDRERTIEASWKSELITTPDLTARFTLTVPANGQLDIVDLVQQLREKGVAGIPPRGRDIAGALFLRPTDGDASQILAGARMYTT
ncbi:MAG TPA: VCBS repeat-containing protein, partial [Thermoanaerobaculia bacterium]|nr:VCBS repeat-containing protein [Thermoanaerobaculia bacterium]